MVWQVWLVQRRGRGGAWGGVSLRKMGVAIVKRLQFLIPNRGAWWTGWDTLECAAHPSWEEETGERESERERARERGRERERGDVKFQMELPYRGERENRFPIKAKDVGVKGQQVLWEGITGPRLLHVSLLGLRGSSAWKWVPLSGTVPDIESSWESSSLHLSSTDSRCKVMVTWRWESEYSMGYNQPRKQHNDINTRDVNAKVSRILCFYSKGTVHRKIKYTFFTFNALDPSRFVCVLSFGDLEMPSLKYNGTK